MSHVNGKVAGHTVTAHRGPQCAEAQSSPSQHTLWWTSGGSAEFWRMILILCRLMAPLPSRVATPGSILELAHSGDRA